MPETIPNQRLYIPEDETYQGGHLLHNLLLFGRVCRILGMDVTPNRMAEVAQALEFVALGRKSDVYFAMQSLLVTQKKDLALFDEAFKLFWQKPADGMTTLNLFSLGEERNKRKTQFLPSPDSSPDAGGDDAAKPPIDPNLIAIVPTYSQQEILRYKDFSEMTADELAQAQAMIEMLPRAISFRQSRRYRTGKGQTPDMRRSFRHALRHAGEIVHLPTRVHKQKPRPIVLISDISGSMERYTRVLLHFMHTLANTRYQVESFVFSTHLTRITHPIRHTSVDIALRNVGTAVRHWGAGTNTGASLHTFNYQWARRVLGRGAIVLLISDGWDRGDPDMLRKEMLHLKRQCYRFIWLNPLLGSEAYEPLTRGALAMLPYVDAFLPVHNLASLLALMKILRELTGQRVV